MKEELPDYRLVVRKPSHSELCRKWQKIRMNENDNEEVNKFSYLSSVVTNTGGAGKM